MNNLIMFCLRMNQQSNLISIVGCVFIAVYNLGFSNRGLNIPSKSMYGVEYRTNVIIFSGIMDAECLERIFEAGLLPFLRDVFPDVTAGNTQACALRISLKKRGSTGGLHLQSLQT